MLIARWSACARSAYRAGVTSVRHSPRAWRGLAALLLVPALLVAPALTSGSPASAARFSVGSAADRAGDRATERSANRTAGIAADDEQDAFVGTGGLLLPASVDSATRREVAGCPNCQWRVTSPCVEQPLGNAFDGQSACLSVTRGCQVGSLRRTWFRPEARPWRDLGLVCLRDDPVTVESIGGRVQQELVHRLPVLAVRMLPRSGVVTGIATAFSSGQSDGRQRFSWRIAGSEVSVVAEPSWSWRFPDGEVTVTSDPGTVSPAGPVRHVFRRSGSAPVACVSRWAGEYWVDGLGPFPIPGAVHQEMTVRVAVGEGRALLTP